VIRPEEDLRERQRDDPHDTDVGEPVREPEPARARQQLEQRGPEQRAAEEEQGVLQRVHGVVVERGVVERRHVPEADVDRPQRQGDERMREDAQRAHGPERERRPEQRAAQPEHEAERGEVADQQMLSHVQREVLLLAEPVER